ncbi:YitT family protein [Gracilibacillus salitolerans]|uniref:YitT family protein n=1 Tax=Gracilibacillus salitolerans TaxID=2663022 RepID=A0A5Q2THH8_9BACI|nr:YitT family protein [Gracilibacillus salitolerans]QGH34186.1 YitT family protein [Gracilibacillus salitolerans]
MLQKIARSFIIYILGIITLTLGISLTIQSQLGASPFDALLVGLYRSFGLSIGSWEIIVGFSIVMINALAIKVKPELFAMLTSLITGIGIDSWLFIQGSWLTPGGWLEQCILLLLGIIFSGIGIAIYLESSFAPNPMDRSMVILTDKTGLSFGKSRAIISIALVIIALLFQGDVGIGTLLNALFTGVIIQALRPYIVSFKQKYVVRNIKAS